MDYLGWELERQRAALAALLLLTVTLLPAMGKGSFRRWQGAALLGLYGGYLVLLFR